MAMNSSSNNVDEDKTFAFDLNVEPVDETFDLNVEPVDQENHNDSNSPSDPDSCSVCQEALVNNNGGDQRTLVTLKCAHKFHLDCLGSAYNANGLMRCPNCRNVEPGQWRFSNGNFNVEVMDDEEERGEEEEEEDVDPGFFSDLTMRSELCPFGNLNHRYPYEGLQCIYVECYFIISRYFSGPRVTEISDSSDQRNIDTEEVIDPNDSPVNPPRFSYRSPYPLFPHIPVPSNRRIFWRASCPGVMIARHYLSHPYNNHSSIGRTDISMVSSYPSSSTMQPNPNPSFLAPISRGHGITMTFHAQPTRGLSDSLLPSYGSNQVINNIGSNPFNVWVTDQPFLEPLQHIMIESEFYTMIYGNTAGGNDTSGYRNNRGGGSGNHGSRGTNGNGGSGNFGGNGNGNGISG